jgi:hypothetical protein
VLSSIQESNYLQIGLYVDLYQQVLFAILYFQHLVYNFLKADFVLFLCFCFCRFAAPAYCVPHTMSPYPSQLDAPHCHPPFQPHAPHGHTPSQLHVPHCLMLCSCIGHVTACLAATCARSLPPHIYTAMVPPLLTATHLTPAYTTLPSPSQLHTPCHHAPRGCMGYVATPLTAAQAMLLCPSKLHGPCCCPLCSCLHHFQQG